MKPPEADQRAAFIADCDRFCDVFPDAFYISERGRDYVASLISLIRGNDLEVLDRARLRDMAPHFLVAVGEGAE